MLKKALVGFALALSLLACERSAPDHEPTFIEKLYALPGLRITEIEPQNGFPRQFEIYISQPLDHAHPLGARFEQQIFLSHRRASAPVVFMPSGYNARAAAVSELAELLDANQIHVAHRFMLGARPDVMEWEYLTVEQAAADFHSIVSLFKTLYPGRWVSCGTSKNGDSALFHRRFYPDDVDATLAKVAPISFAVEDPRYDAFLETVGDEAIRAKIRQFQIALLENRDGILPLLRNYMDNSPWTYSMPEGAILEFEALEYPFAFWQYGAYDISLVPDPGLSAQEMYDILEASGALRIYCDEYIDFYEPFYYQMYTELGYYRLIDDHVSHLLVDLEDPSYSYFAPKGVPLNFSPATMQDVHSWLQTEGNNIIYIYGGIDPWTAGAVELTGATNAFKIVQPGANHSVMIGDLDERELVYSTLEAWLGVPVRRAGARLSRDAGHGEVVFPPRKFRPLPETPGK